MRVDFNENWSGKLAIFSRSRGGVKNKHFCKVFGLQTIILEWTIHFQNKCKHKPENERVLENYAKLWEDFVVYNKEDSGKLKTWASFWTALNTQRNFHYATI